MKRSFEDVLTISQREKVDMRTAALMLGIGRVAAATYYLVQVLFLLSFL
jgi:glutamate dehydrogenase/leucine dehydrogenase